MSKGCSALALIQVRTSIVPSTQYTSASQPCTRSVAGRPSHVATARMSHLASSTRSLAAPLASMSPISSLTLRLCAFRSRYWCRVDQGGHEVGRPSSSGGWTNEARGRGCSAHASPGHSSSVWCGPPERRLRGSHLQSGCRARCLHVPHRSRITCAGHAPTSTSRVNRPHFQRGIRPRVSSRPRSVPSHRRRLPTCGW